MVSEFWGVSGLGFLGFRGLGPSRVLALVASISPNSLKPGQWKPKWGSRRCPGLRVFVGAGSSGCRRLGFCKILSSRAMSGFLGGFGPPQKKTQEFTNPSTLEAISRPNMFPGARGSGLKEFGV